MQINGEKVEKDWAKVTEAVSDVYSVCEYMYNGSACTVGMHATLGCWQKD